MHFSWFLIYWVITCNFTRAKLSRLYSMNTPRSLTLKRDILRIEILEEIKCGNNSETAVSELVVSVCHPPKQGDRGSPFFWLRLFSSSKGGLFLFLKGVARQGRAHRISASQLGELVLIEDRH